MALSVPAQAVLLTEAQVCAAFRDELRQQKDDSHEELWTESDDGTLSLGERLFILGQALRDDAKYWSIAQVAKTLFRRLETGNKVPLRAGAKKWIESGLYRFINFDTKPPDQGAIDVVLEFWSELVQETLDNRDRDPANAKVLQIIRAPWSDPFDCYKAVRGSIGLDGTPKASWKLESVIGGSFRVPTDAVDPPEIDRSSIDEAVKKANAFLRAGDRPRLFVIRAAPASGKKLVLREIVSHLVERLGRADQYRLQSGDFIPVFACALDENSPDQLVDQLFRFYAQAFGLKDLSSLPLSSKQQLIYTFCTHVPALLMISDVPESQTGAVFRDVAQDHAGSVIHAVLKGHPLSRVLVTTVQENQALASLEASGIGYDEFAIPSKISLPKLYGVSHGGLARGSRLCIRLAEAARLLHEAKGIDKDAHLLALRAQVIADRPLEIVEDIWAALDGEERVVLGLISCSRDGVPLGDLQAMLECFRGARILKDLPKRSGTELIGLVEALPKLVQVRRPRDASGDGDTHLFLDDGWRRYFMEAFFKDQPNEAKFGSWLVARAAEAKCQSLRIDGWRTAHPSDDAVVTASVLIALLGSLHLADIKSWQWASDDKEKILAAEILPTLAVADALPSEPTIALRFAFTQILRLDLNGTSPRFSSVFDAPPRYLRVLLAFFHPEAPWMLVEEVSLDCDPAAYQPLKRALTEHEFAQLLEYTSGAAYRARRFDVVAATARLADQRWLSPRVDKEPLPEDLYWSIWRREIEVELLIGRQRIDGKEPGVKDIRGFTIASVSDDIERLLKRFPADAGPIEQQRASGMLWGLLGEVRRLMGEMAAADVAFKRGLDMVQALRAIAAPAVEVSPVLGERYTRSRMRFAFSEATRDRWADSGWCGEFEGGATIALPVMLDERSPAFRRARDLLAARVRMMHSLGVPARARCLIDSARLEAVQLKYFEALKLLGPVELPWFGGDIDVALEWIAVRLRVLHNAALVTLARPCLRDDVIDRRINEIGGLFDDVGDDPPEIARALLVRAASDVQGLQQFVSVELPGGRCEFRPYAMFADLMHAWHQFLSSRIEAPARSRELLASAAETLRDLEARMKATGIKVHQAEVARLIAQLSEHA